MSQEAPHIVKFSTPAPQHAPAHFPLRVRVETAGVVLTPLAKRLDAHQAIALRLALLDHIDRGQRHLIVDLGYVEWMDSSVLNVLVSAFQRAGREGGSFVVCTLHDRVRALFAGTRLDRVIPIDESAQVADSPAIKISPKRRRRCGALAALWGAPSAPGRPGPSAHP